MTTWSFPYGYDKYVVVQDYENHFLMTHSGVKLGIDFLLKAKLGLTFVEDHCFH